MIRELAEIDVKRGLEAEFEKGVAKALPFFLRSKGCHGAKLFRSLEQPSRFRLIVDWDTLEDHMIEFRNSDAFVQWRRIAGPFFASTPRIEHIVVVIDSADQMSPANGLDGSA